MDEDGIVSARSPGRVQLRSRYGKAPGNPEGYEPLKCQKYVISCTERSQRR
jgi:hypothetical protein